MMDSVDVIVRKRDPEAFWIAAGLGGGTGAGGSFVLANELRKIYKHIPVYGIGVVPSVSGMPNEKEALNLSNTLKSFELLNSLASWQTWHSPQLTGPLAGSMTQWC